MKILAVSDLHFHDYTQRNPSEKFRLYQTRLVAQNIIEVGTREGCEAIVFAGDIIEKSIIRPYVQAEVKRFLDQVMSHFKMGFIIWGNHDLDNKGSDQDPSDCCVNVMLPPNLYYADGRITELDGSRIAFSNWKPKFDLNWIQTPVDVLFSHATISYDPNEFFQSQYLDESKFNLAILGDIHKPAQKGKLVSIGVPQRAKMGDYEKATGVIYDTRTKKFNWVDLNPKDNLLKFSYTDKPEFEGYVQSEHTWYVYKPSGNVIDNGITKIQVPVWDEVNNLIQNVIDVNGFGDLHKLVTSTLVDSEGEVDFDFKLIWFGCKNWRSIDDLEVYFNEGDRILIKGSNGSGKSSLMSALRYAFIENRFIKDFIQFGSKECSASVKFYYQGKVNELTRGSKNYGLVVDGQEVKYGSKAAFEEDVRRRFPFLEYLPLFIFDENHRRFIGDMKPEEKSDLISKFFNLGRIEKFNETAVKLKAVEEKSIESIRLRVQQNLSQINYAENLMASIQNQLPQRSSQELMEERDLMNRRYLDWKAWNEWKGLEQQKLAILNTSIQELKSAEDEVSKLSSIPPLDPSISQEISDLTEILIKWESISRDRESLIKDLNQCQSDIRELESSLSMIDNATCHACSTPLSEEKKKIAKDQVLEKIARLKERESSYETRLNSLPSTSNSEFIAKRDRKKYLIEQKESYDRVIMSQKSAQDRYERAKITLEGRQRDLDQFRQSCQVSSVDYDLPSNFVDHLNQLSRGIELWEQMATYTREANDRRKENEDLGKSIADVIARVELLNTYIELTGPTGKIYEEIMNKLCKDFSDNLVKYEVNVGEFRKKKYLDLVSYYRNSQGQWVPYQSASTGQKTILDVNFMSKIVTRMGLIVMDEFLANLDSENHDLCLEWIRSMNLGTLLLSSHMETLGNFNNKMLQLSLNDSGLTVIEGA